MLRPLVKSPLASFGKHAAHGSGFDRPTGVVVVGNRILDTLS